MSAFCSICTKLTLNTWEVETSIKILGSKGASGFIITSIPISDALDILDEKKLITLELKFF